VSKRVARVSYVFDIDSSTIILSTPLEDKAVMCCDLPVVKTEGSTNDSTLANIATNVITNIAIRRVGLMLRLVEVRLSAAWE